MVILASFIGSAETKKKRKTPTEFGTQVITTSLTWHGAHDTGLGKDRDIFCRVDLVKDCIDGEYEIYLCSTACLRKFLASWVDALEEKVRQEKKKIQKSKRR